MARMQAVYYRDPSGAQPVKDFLRRLVSPHAMSEMKWHIRLLSDQDEHAPPLAFPYSSQVRGELRELRCHHGRSLYRILYRRSDRLVALLHAFEKRTGKVPLAEIGIAERRWEDYKTRMEARPRVGLRAVGQDAP